MNCAHPEASHVRLARGGRWRRLAHILDATGRFRISWYERPRYRSARHVPIRFKKPARRRLVANDEPQSRDCSGAVGAHLNHVAGKCKRILRQAAALLTAPAHVSGILISLARRGHAYHSVARRARPARSSKKARSRLPYLWPDSAIMNVIAPSMRARPAGRPSRISNPGR